MDDEPSSQRKDPCLPFLKFRNLWSPNQYLKTRTNDAPPTHSRQLSFNTFDPRSLGWVASFQKGLMSTPLNNTTVTRLAESKQERGNWQKEGDLARGRRTRSKFETGARQVRGQACTTRLGDAWQGVWSTRNRSLADAWLGAWLGAL